jgi:hypothetical protein
LVDFGLASKFLDKNGKHIPKGSLSMFKGNMLFASYNQMNFGTTSRKDDLISLYYILIYLLHEG